MPLDKHLVVHLQEMYSTERDYRDFLTDWSGQLQDHQLRTAVQEQINGIARELGNLQECLSAFGSFPKEEARSPIVQALRQEDRAAEQAMPNMTPADKDVHVAISDISFGHLEIGKYEGMLDMARALNRREVIDKLQENLSHEREDVDNMRNLLPHLIATSNQQQRAA